MKGSEDCVSILCELGLSISQAKIYLSLAKSKNLKAQEISAISGIARPYVYGVLVQLEEAGLVDKTISKPEEFHAIPIEECIHRLLQIRIVKTAELQMKGYEIAQNFKQNTNNEELSKESQFTLIQNREAVYAKAEKMVRSAQKTVCFVALKRRLLAWISNYSQLLDEALVRGVDFKIILPKSNIDRGVGEPIEALMKYPNFHLRLTSEYPDVGFSIWDKNEIQLSTSNEDTPFPHPTLWSKNKCLVNLSQNYFDFLWKSISKQKIKKPRTFKKLDLL